LALILIIKNNLKSLINDIYQQTKICTSNFVFSKVPDENTHFLMTGLEWRSNQF